MVNAPVQPEMSFFQTIQHYLNPRLIWQKITESKDVIFDVIVFSGVGFLVGFVLKRYGEYVAVLVGFILALVLLQHFELLNIGINWAKINHCFGLKPIVVPEGGSLAAVYWEWVTQNVAAVIGFFVGFFVGLRVG
ncbi:MAG: FUN14 domain-containing protein [Candidatus Dependentiae bacterium]|nr:FUN14 domain-containing protein [Candidatus Dependentiae bacterium]